MKNELRSQLQVHSRYVVTPCFCCGQDYEQQFVTVLLLDGDKKLGTICPACLVRGPRRTAQRLQEYADQLRTEAEELQEQRLSLSPPQQGWIMPAELRAEHLLHFASRLAQLGDTWDTSLQEVIDAEKNYFREHFTTMPEEYLTRLVELRYQPFLKGDGADAAERN